MDDYYKASSSYLDEPANSRLFLVTSKTITENTIREHFTAFGEIQDVWLVKDKHTKESKGVGFVKFAKSSQACTAMEEMHGRCLEEGTKPLKVFIAQSRSSGSHRDVEDEDLTRIFVMIPKTFTEEDLKETFRVYGNIEYASIIKNKGTGESKGLGYVTFHKPSQAATAIENCEKSFRAILAEPKNKSADNDYFSNFRTENDPGLNLYPHAHESSSFSGGDASRSTEVMTRCLMVSSRSALPKEHVYALFDLIPGMEYAEPHRDPYNFSNGQLIVRYNSLGSAVYAKEKLNGFEYPPGNRLSVSFVDDGDDRTSPVMNMAVQLVAAQMMSMVWNNSSGSPLTKTSTNSFVPQKSRVQTDVSLPPLKSLEQPDTPVAERLFVIFNPSPLPVDVLEDVFCRFGSLVEVYLVPGRNLGYIKYGERTNAHEAMTLMHGKVVNGVRMKVMLADPPKTESHKRQRTY